MNLRSTHTYVTMEVSPATYAEIEAKFREAGYDHVFDGEAMDMHGIALVPTPKAIFDRKGIEAVQQIMADLGVPALAGRKRPRRD
jgi:hypothetical protein